MGRYAEQRRLALLEASEVQLHPRMHLVRVRARVMVRVGVRVRVRVRFRVRTLGYRAARRAWSATAPRRPCTLGLGLGLGQGPAA